ncbi:hypothetical protein [Rubrimonas cliftonensis]|uniref:Precorrin-3B synthase n=1 Tax=Rubrimonas cliftonensis TaxID=89524 RepID=A0A1H4FWD3_9RHOB|nr:hypothetical protein [Rubrimonas cliftonensis]SEB01636.1 precorrin-3B synthase [Rubrimonas cliftonensis]
MSGAVKGWCPGAHRPMTAADGLIVRVRPPLGALSPETAAGFAALAARWGSGRIELTARANLQLRGVRPGALEALLAGLDALGLLDADPATEARRNVVLTPFRDDARDLEAVAAGLAEGLADPAFAGLPGKFGFVVDAAPGARALTGVSGDVRVEGSGPAMVVRPDGAPTGRIVTDAAEAVALALALARWFLAAGGVGPDGRGRMRALLATGALPPAALVGAATPDPAAPPPRPGPRAGGLCVAAALGEMSADALERVARAADDALRVTPFRMLFLPRVASGALLGDVAGLILDPDDPLLRVTACVGAPDCAEAGGATRGAARALAPYVRPGSHLHVSGCAKGCARPGPAPWTLVARGGRFDLVAGGAARDAPAALDLTPDDARRRIQG